MSVSLRKRTNLNDVVVIGYGTQRREAVTGSVANVKGDLLREVPGSDVSQALPRPYRRCGDGPVVVKAGSVDADPYSWNTLSYSQ